MARELFRERRPRVNMSISAIALGFVEQSAGGFRPEVVLRQQFGHELAMR